MFWKTFDVIVAVLLVIGGILWGLMGFFEFDLFNFFFGDFPWLGRIFYGVVGICALYQAFQWRVIARRWGCEVPSFFGSAAH
ncbi:MAG: DUF378 domain-containing protein [Deltaproteobacteria bacterium]